MPSKRFFNTLSTKKQKKMLNDFSQETKQDILNNPEKFIRPEYPYLSREEKVIIEDTSAHIIKDVQASALENPIKIDLMKMAEDYFGIPVLYLDNLPDKIDGRFDPSFYNVILNANKTEDRQRFSLAHEFGHITLHDKHRITKAHQDHLMRQHLSRENNKKNKREIEANFFAGCLLMPANAVTSLWKKVFNQIELKPIVIHLTKEEIIQNHPHENTKKNYALYTSIKNAMVQVFKTSHTASRIRLQNLNLLQILAPLPNHPSQIEEWLYWST